MKPKLIIIGTGGHAKVVAEAAELQGKYSIEGFVSSEFKKDGDSFMGYALLGGMDYLLTTDLKHISYFFIAIGDNFSRHNVYLKYILPFLKRNMATIIHPNAQVSEKAKIQEGAFIAMGACIVVGGYIRRGAVVNTGASIDHDCYIGEFSSIAPRAVLGGNVNIGDETAIGIGATLKHKVKVGNYSVIGAGSIVVKDIPDNVVAYGNPCKVIRSRKPHDPYL